MGGVVADVESDAGIVNGGALAADDRLIAQSIQDFRISIAARRPIGAGRYQRWIRDGNRETRRRTHARDRRWGKTVRAPDPAQAGHPPPGGLDRGRGPGGPTLETGLDPPDVPLAGRAR